MGISICPAVLLAIGCVCVFEKRPGYYLHDGVSAQSNENEEGTHTEPKSSEVECLGFRRKFYSIIVCSATRVETWMETTSTYQDVEWSSTLESRHAKMVSFI